MDALIKFSVATVLAATLSGCSGCGEIANDDAGTADAIEDRPSEGAADSATVRATCLAGPQTGATDAAPGTPGTITCPVGWHCDHYQSATPGGACCPPGHTDVPYDPACAVCPCIGTCCVANFSCADWDAAPNVCDGG
jgi:hypothetical protein